MLINRLDKSLWLLLLYARLVGVATSTVKQGRQTEIEQDGLVDAKNASIFKAAGVGVFPVPNVILEMTKRRIEVHNWIETKTVQQGEESCYKNHEQKIHDHVNHQVAKIVGEKLKESGFDIEFKNFVPEDARMSDEELAQLEVSNEGWASDQSKLSPFVINEIDRYGSSGKNISKTEERKDDFMKVHSSFDDVLGERGETTEQMVTSKSIDEVKLWSDTSQYAYEDIIYDDNEWGSYHENQNCCDSCECTMRKMDQWHTMEKCVDILSVTIDGCLFYDHDLTLIQDKNQAAALVISNDCNIIASVKTEIETDVKMEILQTDIDITTASCVVSLKIEQLECTSGCQSEFKLVKQFRSRSKRSLWTSLINAVDNDEFMTKMHQIENAENARAQKIMNNEKSLFELNQKETLVNKKRIDQLVDALETKLCNENAKLNANRIVNTINNHANQIVQQIIVELSTCWLDQAPPILHSKFKGLCTASYPILCEKKQFYELFTKLVHCQPLGVVVAPQGVMLTMKLSVPEGPRASYTASMALSLPVIENHEMSQLVLEPNTVIFQVDDGRATTAVTNCQARGLSNYDLVCNIHNQSPKMTYCLASLMEKRSMKKACLTMLPEWKSDCFAAKTPYGLLLSTGSQGVTVTKNANAALNGFISENGGRRVSGVVHLLDESDPVVTCNSISYRSDERSLELTIKGVTHFEDTKILSLVKDKLMDSMQPYQAWAENTTINSLMELTSFHIGTRPVKVGMVVKVVLVLLLLVALGITVCCCKTMNVPCRIGNSIIDCVQKAKNGQNTTVRYHQTATERV